MKGLALTLSLFAAAFSSAASIRIDQAYPSDISGNPLTVALGESFYMSAKLHIDGPLSSIYRLHFDPPYESRITCDLNLAGDPTVVWGPFTALLGSPMNMKVSVEAPNDQAGDPLTIQIAPTLPSSAIESFAPQNLAGVVGGGASLTAGSISGLQWFAPIPTSEGFQQVLSANFSGVKISSAPFNQPVASVSGIDTETVQFATVASGQRVRSDLLRTATFNSFRSIPLDIRLWLRPETLVESSSGEVSRFVGHVLPRNYRQTMTPYDAAQRLFQAVVGRMSYLENGSKPDALLALRTGRGDCGAFSSLFVACCRNIGIPARAVCGMTLGDCQWHVWSEFYLPGFGWVPADAAYSDAICPDGSLPVYFGTVPDLNRRVAVTYGFDHFVGKYRLPMLQSPALFLTPGTSVTSFNEFCTLSVAGTN